MTSSELDKICDVIRCHNQRKKSDSLSDCANLIQDADLIDHVGLIDVWITFYWSGHHGEFIQDNIAYYKGDDYQRYRAYMRIHLNFDVSRQMFEERIRLEDDLLSRFHITYFDGI